MLKNKKILIFGVSGRVGKDLAIILLKENEVHGVARFTQKELRQELETLGVKTIPMDVAEDDLKKLPTNFDYIFNEIAFMHGAEEDPGRAYKTNAYFVARLMERFKKAQGIIHASTGNVYGLPGKVVTEESPEAPVGTYGLSRFVGEQMVKYFSVKYKTPAVILRYFYGNDERYGVIYKLGNLLLEGKEIPAYFGSQINCIAHSDLVEFTARAAIHCSIPPITMNITSTHPFEVKDLVIGLAKVLEVENVKFQESEERERMTLAAYTPIQTKLLGQPKVCINEMIQNIAKAVLKQKQS
ncbi:MAG: NAD-dependent epimerase/dehydratase family protein [bacterium]